MMNTGVSTASHPETTVQDLARKLLPAGRRVEDVTDACSDADGRWRAGRAALQTAYE
ncbi:hypothetical protein [Bradyrhizobium rifense]|uniref:hypothetical protein n=1 Tax=Bradyrhizobium rifense TaxID=515499 RepID=UPI001652E007|nr:hypothetical protein [Bradyrhizobium rifense]